MSAVPSNMRKSFDPAISMSGESNINQSLYNGSIIMKNINKRKRLNATAIFSSQTVTSNQKLKNAMNNSKIFKNKINCNNLKLPDNISEKLIKSLNKSQRMNFQVKP